jgi:2-methylisocitrate lyase-like PEP mutase family enzyme
MAIWISLWRQHWHIVSKGPRTVNKRELFKSLHKGDEPLVLPNAWNAGSARMMEMAGFKAIATTSAGIAFSHGLPDGSALSKEIVFQEIEKIIKAVDIPVTTDIETGYGDIARTVLQVKVMGAAGCNIEDADGRTLDNLFDIHAACDQIAEARGVAKGNFVINARTDTYLTGHPQALREAIHRGNAYVEAGADCVFVPGIQNINEIVTLVDEIQAPVNVLAGVGPSPLTVQELTDCGVKRISTGGSLVRHTMKALASALQEVREGRFDYATNTISDDDVNEMFRR